MAGEHTIGRDYCRGCGRESVQRFAGYATDGAENSVRPRAFYRTCTWCGTTRLVLGNVNDAEGLCRTVLKTWLSSRDTGTHIGATGRPRGDGALDPEDALAYLQAEVWQLYTVWRPELSADSFLAYASELLPRRLAVWSRDTSGEASERGRGRRRYPKAHAASVSVSYDQLIEGYDDGEGSLVGDAAVAARASGGVDGGAGGFVADHAEDLSPDLARLLGVGGGAEARDQQERRESGVAEAAGAS